MADESDENQPGLQSLNYNELHMYLLIRDQMQMTEAGIRQYCKDLFCRRETEIWDSYREALFPLRFTLVA